MFAFPLYTNYDLLWILISTVVVSLNPTKSGPRTFYCLSPLIENKRKTFSVFKASHIKAITWPMYRFVKCESYLAFHDNGNILLFYHVRLHSFRCVRRRRLNWNLFSLLGKFSRHRTLNKWLKGFSLPSSSFAHSATNINSSGWRYCSDVKHGQ